MSRAPRRRRAAIGPAIALVTSFVLSVPTAVSSSLQRTAVVVHDADRVSFRAVARELERHGAKLRHRFPPELLVGHVPPQAVAGLDLPPGVTIDVVTAGAASTAAPLGRFGGAVSFFLSGRTRDVDPAPRPTGFGNDAVARVAGVSAQPQLKGIDPCGRPFKTSEVMIGSISIGIIMPESTGPMTDPDLEDWSTPDPAFPMMDRRDLVVAEIMEGLDFLAAQHPLANLSFSYDVPTDVNVPFEPIEHDASDSAGWVLAAMDQVAFRGFSPTSSVRDYLNHLRDLNDTDWSTVAFVIDSLQDADGAPPNGFPFAYASSTTMVMTYDNSSWGIDDMDTVLAHEIAHNFGALDEYQSAGNSCSQVRGYLAVENANNDSPPGDTACVTADTCIMRAQRGAVCGFTSGQLGIRDTDGDGILDVRDVPGNSTFDGPNPLVVNTAALNLAGRVAACGLATESPHSPVQFTLNRVAGAEFRVDGGPWISVGADDGLHDERCEDVTIALMGLSEGWHRVELRTTNDVGIVEPSPAELDVYVNTDCPDDTAEPDDFASEATPRPAGTHAGLRHCAYDADWSRFYLTRGAAVTATVSFDAGAGVSVALHDAAEREIAVSSPTSSSTAELSAVAVIDGTYYLKVQGTDELETDYQLVIDAECINDEHEPNDVLATSGVLPPSTYDNLVVCAGDVDHYRVGLQAGESLSADIAFDGSLGDLDLVLLDPTGAQADLSDGTGDSESVSVAGSVEGVYTVIVRGKGPTDRNVHSLVLNATGCIDDAGENDDDAASPRALVNGELHRGVICDGDEDWYTFTLDDTSLLELDLSYDPAVGNLDVELIRASDLTVVRRSVRLDSPEDITAERMLGGTYLVRVFSQFGGTGAYTLRQVAADPILLFVHKDPEDAILTWNDARQECYRYRRSENPADWSGAVTQLLRDGGEVHSVLEHGDRGVIFDGIKLYCYRIEPDDCGLPLLRSTKTVKPSPVLVADPNGGPRAVEYTITAVNSGRDDLFGVRIRDDVPTGGFSYTVLEIPAGATDSSLPAPAGAFGQGQLLIEGVNVPAGGTARVRWEMAVSRSAPPEFANVVDNQAVVIMPDPLNPSGGTEFPTDDPTTSAVGDDTRMYNAGFTQFMNIAAFWHRNVDIDMRVIDPCGNALSPRDLLVAPCDMSTGYFVSDHSCASPSFPTRTTVASWLTWPIPAGRYAIELAYVEQGTNGPGCSDRGDEEVTIVVHYEDSTSDWRTVTLPAEATSFVRVWEFDHW